MNATCAICFETFKNADSDKLNITKCGHLFHSLCLSQWLLQSKTCPECRTETKSTIRVYCNIASPNNSSYIMDRTDVTNLKKKMLEKCAIIEDQKEMIAGLSTKLKKVEALAEKYKKLEARNASKINSMQSRFNEVCELKAKLDEANARLARLNLVKSILASTRIETEKLLREEKTVDELATMVTVLQRQLDITSRKLKYERDKYNALSKRVKVAQETIAKAI